MTPFSDITREFLKSNLKLVSGCMPVYKPKGVCLNRLLYLLRWDLYFVLNAKQLNHGSYAVDYARNLEPFAEGLVTFVFKENKEIRKNFVLANYRYRATIELGVKRNLHCIDGHVLSRSSVSNVDKELISEHLKSFVGQINQRRCPTYTLPPSEKPLIDYKDYFNRVSIDSAIKPPKEQQQKYPFVAPLRSLTIESLDIIDYSSPLLELDISCYGCFSTRQFTLDLAERLNTHASLVKLFRYKEGPMYANDLRVFQIEDLNLDYYMTRLCALRETYKGFMGEINPLWDDIKT